MPSGDEDTGYGMTIKKFRGEEYIDYLRSDLAYAPESVSEFKFLTQKPDFPYLIGKCLKAHPHIPPAPGRGFPDFELTPEDRKELKTVDPLHRSLLHPPSAGESTAGEVELEIVNLIRAGDPRDSQLLAVHIFNSTLELPTDMGVLAKVYDPLYFNHIQRYANPFSYSDVAYINESAAYNHLVDLQGSIIPKFYGSFTLSLSVEEGKSREVRFILMENVSGSSMHKLDPQSFKQSERKAIMKAIVDSETSLYDRDTIHKDIHPRNILLPPKPFDQDRKVVIIDFGLSLTTRNDPEVDQEWLPGVSISPLLRWIEPNENFEGWVDWDWGAWIEEQYAYTKSSITEYMRKKWGPDKQTINFDDPCPWSSTDWEIS